MLGHDGHRSPAAIRWARFSGGILQKRGGQAGLGCHEQLPLLEADVLAKRLAEGLKATPVSQSHGCRQFPELAVLLQGTGHQFALPGCRQPGQQVGFFLLEMGLQLGLEELGYRCQEVIRRSTISEPGDTQGQHQGTVVFPREFL